ncbi:MAG: hypothetical protein OXH38_02570 [Chloroflexi bacterium]|nr:hypothetical protein [Chloroflexota bacterium]
MTTESNALNSEELEDLEETDWEHAVELESLYGPDAEVWGSPCVDFNPAELKLLMAACRLADEDSIDFIKRAAMDRIALVLTEQAHQPPSATAAD